LVCDDPSLALDAVGSSTPTVQNRRLRYADVSQNRAQTRTTVGKSGHLGGVGPTHGSEVLLEQRGDVGLGPGDGTEDLAATVNRLDIADDDFQVTFAIASRLRMKVESNVTVIAVAADGGFFATTSASCLPTRSIWLRKVQLRRRPTVRWPTDTGRTTAAASAQEPWKLQSHLAKQRGNPVR
jgi:hypothetical protein